MVQQTTTAKIQLITTENDRKLLKETMSSYRSACNYVSNYIFQTHDINNSSLSKALYYKLREKFGLKSQMTCSVMRTVIASYKTILQNQKEWIKAIYKKPQYDLIWNRDYSLTKDFFSINTLKSRLKLDYFSKGMCKYFDKSKYKFGAAKLVHKHGKFFLHIAVTFDVPETILSDICNVVGIDRGVNFIITTYDSSSNCKFINGREIKYKRACYSKLRKELQMKKTSSARRRLKAIGQRENRWMHDINHQVSKALVEKYPPHTLFVLEDLTGIRKVTEGVRLKNRHISVSWSFFDLEQKIMYKAKLKGAKVIKVNPAYTSQDCPKCGHREKSNRNKSKHLFMCKTCGYKSNDDRIAAMNLYSKGICYINKNQVPCTVAKEYTLL